MKRRIVVVDDNDLTLQWMRKHLEDAGYEVGTYSASFGIQKFVSQFKPDVLILDVNMPALNGNVVCRLLKEKPATRGLHIFLHSSMPAADLAAASRQCGADGFVVKSDDPRHLLNTLDAVVLARPTI